MYGVVAQCQNLSQKNWECLVVKKKGGKKKRSLWFRSCQIMMPRCSKHLERQYGQLVLQLYGKKKWLCSVEQRQDMTSPILLINLPPHCSLLNSLIQHKNNDNNKKNHYWYSYIGPWLNSLLQIKSIVRTRISLFGISIRNFGCGFFQY